MTSKTRSVRSAIFSIRARAKPGGGGEQSCEVARSCSSSSILMCLCLLGAWNGWRRQDQHEAIPKRRPRRTRPLTRIGMYVQEMRPT
jgi:hypothetical protein